MSYIYGPIVGGTLIFFVTLLARKGLPEYAGIIMTFPVVAITSLVFSPVGTSLKIARWGIFGAVAVAGFLTAFVFLAGFLGEERKYLSILLSTILWIVLVLVALKFGMSG